jgi:hypothetical protein
MAGTVAWRRLDAMATVTETAVHPSASFSAALRSSPSGAPRDDGGSAGVREETEAPRCPLQYAAGRVEVCPGPGCPFWEEGGAVLPGGCIVQRLGLDLDNRPELAHALLQVRHKLDQALDREDEDEARSLFYRLVPSAREEEDR